MLEMKLGFIWIHLSISELWKLHVRIGYGSVVNHYQKHAPIVLMP